MPEFCTGDRVKIAREITVTTDDGTYLSSTDGSHYPKHAWKFELLERAKPKVGDLISGPDDASLPIGTLVQHSGVPSWKRLKVGDDRWYYLDLDATDRLGVIHNYTILYIPD